MEKIKEYFDLKNSPVGDVYEEIAKNCRLIDILTSAPDLTKKMVTRFIKDTGTAKVCVYEAECELGEIAFIIAELEKTHGTRVFAVHELIFEVNHG